MTPRVSVLMAVYNGEKYLPEAINSILTQSFTDFEYLIVDDGSTDHSLEIIESYQDPRIKIISNPHNIGLTRSLNKGLNLARGEYVARMDSDDISLPERLAKQVAYMDAHPDVGVCGTWAKDIDSRGFVTGLRETPVGKELEHDYWRPSPIIHPSAIIRRSHLNGLRYHEQIRYAQDFDLWLRIRAKHKLGNLPQHLLLYRVHQESITLSQRDDQLRATYEIFRERVESSEVNFDEFVALNSYSLKLTPVRRTWAMSKLAKAIRQPYWVFFGDDVRYTLCWLRNCFYVAATKMRILKPVH
jgi:glycosyltransferase involved in cell wall biosynthesis